MAAFEGKPVIVALKSVAVVVLEVIAQVQHNRLG